jgi:hypothetical protein
MGFSLYLYKQAKQWTIHNDTELFLNITTDDFGILCRCYAGGTVQKRIG